MEATNDESRRHRLIKPPIEPVDECPPISNALTAKERLRTFNALYEENKGRIHMRRAVNYPINYKLGLKWASRHCDAESAKFAEDIIANTSYVSFGDFMAALAKICTSFKKYHAGRSRGSSVFVMILPFNMTKSNVWVSLLAWPMIRDAIDDIDFDITSVYNRYMFTAAPRKRVICVICDDCAYTGNQLMSYCTLWPARLQYPGKPKEPSPNTIEWIAWNKEITTRTNEIEAGIATDEFAINLLIPYMSTHAQDNIAKRSFMMIPRDVQIFRPFRERANIYEFNQGVIREFESTFQYHTNISAIYFDHKIADAVSTFNKVYLLAPIFGCGNLRQSLCFIDGCCAKDIPADVNVYDVYMNLEDMLKDKTCPPTFYKTIKYTNGGKSVSGLCVQELFASRKSRG